MKRPRPQHRAQSRPAVLLAGAAALLPLTMANAAPAADVSAHFIPPATQMMLSRTLRSPLADGREIVSRRTYAVSIVAEGEGFRVDGKEIDCAVEAPESLAALAALERARRDAGPFPLYLDSNGLLVAEPRLVQNEALHRASGMADAALEKSPPNPDLRLALLDFVATLAAGNQTVWPEDLFRRAAARRVERQQIALPDGTSGAIEVEVVTLPGSENSTRVQRTVTTELGKTRRTTREEWVLAPARVR